MVDLLAAAATSGGATREAPDSANKWHKLARASALDRHSWTPKNYGQRQTVRVHCVWDGIAGREGGGLGGGGVEISPARVDPVRDLGVGDASAQAVLAFRNDRGSVGGCQGGISSLSMGGEPLAVVRGPVLRVAVVISRVRGVFGREAGVCGGGGRRGGRGGRLLATFGAGAETAGSQVRRTLRPGRRRPPRPPMPRGVGIICRIKTGGSPGGERRGCGGRRGAGGASRLWRFPRIRRSRDSPF